MLTGGLQDVLGGLLTKALSKEVHVRISKSIVLSMVFILCLLSASALAQNYKYDEPVMLEGVLLTSTASASITYDEKTHKFPAVKLSKPITVLCATSDKYCEPKAGIALLQLVLKDKQKAQFDKLKGKSVKLSGTLFQSETGHHYTPVLMTVNSIAHPDSDSSARSQGFTTYCNPRYGFCVGYPSSLNARPEPANGDGREFQSADGFQLIISGINNVNDDTLETEMASERKNLETITYQVKKKNWFVLSGYRGAEILYVRKYVGKGAINSLYIKLPAKMKTKYEDAITKISLSFKPGNLNEGH